MRLRAWTDNDKQLAGLMLGLGLRHRCVGIVTGRTANDITSALSKGRLERAHGVERVDLKQRQRPWTDDEDVLVDDLSRRGFKDSQIAGMLHRLAVDVTERKATLGL